jgi:FAD/FMN-containing dehydrogenase
MSLPAAFLEALKSFPPDFATTDAAELLEYGTDWTRVYAPNASLLVRPRTTDEVSVVPSGGRTGLAGGAVARRRRGGALARAHARDGPGGHAGHDGARAGGRGHRGGACSTARRTGSSGRSTSPRRARAQVGGNIATNAGGVKVIRYGLTRQWVLGLRWSPRGRGARAQRRAREEQHRRRPAAALHRQRGHARGHHRGDAEADAAAQAPRRHAPRGARSRGRACGSSSRAERPVRAVGVRVLHRPLLRARARAPRPRRPSRRARGTTCCSRSRPATRRALEGWLEAMLFEQGARARRNARGDSASAQSLWELREGISESLSATGLPHKNDVALPIAELEALLRELEALFAPRATPAGSSASSATSATATCTST